MNPNRVSVLDIDTDIEGGRRTQVLQALRDFYGEDRVANVATWGTEKSKSAILTAAKGLGIDNDEAQYISSLIPSDRGLIRTLNQCYYGDKENGYAPVGPFVQEMKNQPKLWEVAQKIEGLVCRVGEHAGGVIFVDEPFTNSTGLMRAPKGDIITQFDLHDCEDVSLIKIDLLSVEGLDKIHSCLDLLVEHGYVKPEATLQETYEKVIGVYNLDRTSEDMWHMVWEHKIESLFQMEQQSGIQGIALTKPESVDDLAVLNSVIRLMAQDKNSESPLQKYARFKNDISLWYKEMDNYGLTKEEQKTLEPVVKQSYGICESQEKFMTLVQMPECGGFDLTWADKLRKSIAKKNPAAFEELEQEFFQNVKDKHLSEKFCNYVWKVLVSTSKGYGFNASHTLAYSIVALQEMNLAYYYPIIFWNTACLITDSGGDEDGAENKNNDYDKIAKALNKMKMAGVSIAAPDINKSRYTYYPNVEENKIYIGLRGLLDVGENVIDLILKNRPYSNFFDFLNKVNAGKSATISLIKSGAFDSFGERKVIMAQYIWKTCDKKARLNMLNMPTLIKLKMIPDEFKYERSVYEFNRYLKDICVVDSNNNEFCLDERALSFVGTNFDLPLTSYDNHYWINKKVWDKVYQQIMNNIRAYIQTNQKELLYAVNKEIFLTDWNKYAKGSYSAWEMEVMCYYYHDHELINANHARYGLSDFNDLPTDPVVDKIYHRKGTDIPLYKLTRICGTVIAKNKDKNDISLLTTTGVVHVRFRKEYFALFDKQISARGADGSKHVVERSWFNRGNMLVITGIRRGDDFIPKKYASTPGHQLYRILEVSKNGDLILQSERAKGE